MDTHRAVNTNMAVQPCVESFSGGARRVPAAEGGSCAVGWVETKAQ